MKGRLVVAVIAACVLDGSARQRTAVVPPPGLPPSLIRTLDPVIEALWNGFSGDEAMAHVRYVSQFWRLAGNAGYDASIDRMHARLQASGFRPGSSTPAGVWIEEYPNSGKGWSYSVGTLAVVRPGQPDDVVLSADTARLSLCINSFSTPASGVTARLVDVGRGNAEQDYAGKDLGGAVVLGDAAPAVLWRFAVAGRGAVGVVSTDLSRVVSPDPPGAPATPRDRWDILQWGSVPYDEARRGFGFKATPRAATRLRQALAAANGGTTVRVTTATTFSAKPARTLVAELKGRSVPEERIVLAAHVQEPGANDNASGVATLAELARVLASGVADGRIPPPARTLTFLWLDETAGSLQWLREHADAAKNVKYMFSLDMTGEDVRRTGGSFLVERSPDPGAVWDRPWDPHTEWGRGSVRAGQLKGDLLNDLHLAVCLRVAARSGWRVETNPYEGGSDHTVFGSAGVPSVLDWHFTDRYYHTNLDTPDKTSPTEMRNVAVAVGASAWLLASATEAMAGDVAALAAGAGRARITVETREGASLPAHADVLAAWRRWYAEAVRSTARLAVGPVSAAFPDRLTALAREFE